MDSFLEGVLVLPVLVQGALGSLLFWLSFEVARRAFNLALALVARLNRHLRYELKMYQALRFARLLFPPTNPARTFAVTTNLYGAANRIVYALLYICIGLISQPLVGAASAAAYVIAMGFLFLALRAVAVDWNEEDCEESARKQFMALTDELEAMGREVKKQKSERSPGSP